MDVLPGGPKIMGLKRWKWSIRKFLLCVVLLPAVLSGCKGEKMKDPEGMLKVQAEKYWIKRLIEKDYKASYEMEAKKNRLPYDQYAVRVRNAGQLLYAGIMVKGVSLNENAGEVKIGVKVYLPGVKEEPIEMMVPPDPWVIEEGQWKHVWVEKKNALKRK